MVFGFALLLALVLLADDDEEATSASGAFELEVVELPNWVGVFCLRGSLAWSGSSGFGSHGDGLDSAPHDPAPVGHVATVLYEVGFAPKSCAMDKGYDSHAIHDRCEDRVCRPIIAQIRQMKAKTLDDVPTCEHVRRGRLQAQGNEVALFVRFLPAEVRLAQGRPAEPAHPARDEAVGRPLPRPCRHRARVRSLEASVRACPAPGARP